MSNEAVIRKKNDLCRQMLDHLQQAGVQDSDMDALRRALDTSPAGPDTAVLSNTVIMKYKDRMVGDMAAVFKRWIMLN